MKTVQPHLERFLNQVVEGKWELNHETGLIDVNGSVFIKLKDMTINGIRHYTIPVAFGVVNGDFHCNELELDTLKGCPIKVHCTFNCSVNQLGNLDYAPVEVGGVMHLVNISYLVSLEILKTRVGKGIVIERLRLKYLRLDLSYVQSPIHLGITGIDSFPLKAENLRVIGEVVNLANEGKITKEWIPKFDRMAKLYDEYINLEIKSLLY